MTKKTKPPKTRIKSAAAALKMEIVALRKMVTRTFDGSPICCAFGGESYFFEISFCRKNGELALCIDAYSILFPERRGLDFDVDEWDARKVWMSAPPTRHGFRDLARVARQVVNGSTVSINGGTVSLVGFKPHPSIFCRA